MESAQDQNLAAREQALVNWLRHATDLQTVSIQAMPGDASMRRYFRLRTGSQSYVAMDAPPPRENCQPFVAIARAIQSLGLTSPDIIAADSEQGFLVLTDFGDQTYLKVLNAKNADRLYQNAMQALSILQTCREVPGRVIPPFTREFMRQEWSWHQEWFLEKWLGLSLEKNSQVLTSIYELLVETAASQPQVFMHRDFHSANLMVLPGDDKNSVGILDFQDAFMGPVTYDLASLLRDCYIDWPAEQVVAWALQYRQMLPELHNVSEKEFLRWFDWMGLQRHLKALMTFARKHVRDHQSAYLAHVPRTLNYILSVSARYPELSLLHAYYADVVMPRAREAAICVP